IRQEERLLRSEIEARGAALDLRRRQGAQENARRADRRAARAPRPEGDARGQPRQPPLDHARDRRAMAPHHREAPLKNDVFLRALAREPTEYTPVWLMRQAGRYLPEYNATRARAGSFLKLAKTPELACEVTLQPLERLPLDAAILFSDILTIPDAMGLGLYFAEGEGPRFERPLREEWEFRDLTAPDPWDHLRYVMDAVAQIRRALNDEVPLLGFAGSPFTLACYMIEGKGSQDFIEIKRLLYA